MTSQKAGCGMDAVKARAWLKKLEIVDAECNTPTDMYKAGIASGYLDCLERGPEVRGLVEALKKISEVPCNCGVSCCRCCGWDAWTARNAISDFTKEVTEP